MTTTANETRETLIANVNAAVATETAARSALLCLPVYRGSDRSVKARDLWARRAAGRSVNAARAAYHAALSELHAAGFVADWE